MGKIERFEDIEVWKKARVLANSIYQITDSAPFNKDFGLKDQVRRASVSVLSNIVEGFERDGNREFQNYLYIAKGSCGEIRAQLYIAVDQGYINPQEFKALSEMTTEISRMLHGLIKYLQSSSIKGKKYKP